LDANLAISISLVGVVVIIGIITIVDILTGMPKVEKKNHYLPLTG
jgi:hypothetical protein